MSWIRVRGSHFRESRGRSCKACKISYLQARGPESFGFNVFGPIAPGQSPATSYKLAKLINCRECSFRSFATLSRSALVLLALYGLGELVCSPRVLAHEARFERVGPYGGTVRSLLVSTKNSRLVYLGTDDGQLFISTDGGASWKLVYPGLRRRQFVIDSITEDPADADHLYICLLYTSDAADE